MPAKLPSKLLLRNCSLRLIPPKKTPGRAIAFKDGAVKHVYFVAETKGSMSTLDLRGIEDGKIACADRLFEQLSGSGIY